MKKKYLPKNAPVNFRFNAELKESAEDLFYDLGMTMSDAIEIFLHQCVAKGGLPFELKLSKEEREHLKKRCEGARLRKESQMKTLQEKKNKETD